jgi:hypothetical protein
MTAAASGCATSWRPHGQTLKTETDPARVEGCMYLGSVRPEHLEVDANAAGATHALERGGLVELYRCGGGE